MVNMFIFTFWRPSSLKSMMKIGCLPVSYVFVCLLVTIYLKDKVKKKSLIFCFNLLFLAFGLILYLFNFLSVRNF